MASIAKASRRPRANQIGLLFRGAVPGHLHAEHVVVEHALLILFAVVVSALTP